MAKSFSSPETMRLYAGIGRALTAWAAVESALCNIFCDCVNIGQSNPADQIYWAVISFEGKLKVSGEAVRSALSHHPGLITSWTTLQNRLTSANKRRNRLAHGSAVRMRHPKSGKEELYLAPYFWSGRIRSFPTHAEAVSGKYDPRPKDRLAVDAIDQINDGFVALRNRLLAYRKQLREILEREADRIKAIEARRQLRSGGG